MNGFPTLSLENMLHSVDTLSGSWAQIGMGLFL